MKYPVDSYGGKGVKDGGEAGWNYVSFRDDNIRVDHKWTDGEMRFSVHVNPKLREDVRTAISGDSDGKPVGRRREVEFSEMPDMLKAVGVPDLPIRTRTDIVRKLRRDHGFTERQIVGLPEAYGQPAAVFHDGKAYVVLTGMQVATRGGVEKPVMVVLRESIDRNGRHEFLASAYPREEANENFYTGLARNGKLLFIDKNKVAVIGLNGRTISTLNEQADGNHAKTPEDISSFVPGSSIPQGGRGTQEIRPSIAGYRGAAAEMRFSVSSPYDPRKKLEKPRKGWTEKAIKKELREGSLGGVWWGAKLMSEFDSVKELKEHMFYHGTENYLNKLKPSIVQTEKWAEKHGGGGYGNRQWGISVSKSKRVASNFGGQRTAGVDIYPVVLAKNAKVIERPEWTDALDVEGHVVELWNEGVDAVRLGDWAADHSERELLVLNPRAVAVAGNSDYYRVFRLGTESNPINIKDDAQLEKMLEVAKDYATYNEHDRFGKPYPPDLWKINDDGSYGEMKTAAERAAVLKSYEDDLAAWRKSEAGRAAEEYEYRVRDEIRFSVSIAPKYRGRLSFGQVDERKAKSTVAAWRKSRTEFVNRRNLRVAELKSDWSKVFSSKAKGQSDSYEAHYAAANNLKTLFENGVKYHEERPRNGSADIAAYAKYACPFDVNGETYLAKITVKEYPARGGAKDGIYSVEAIEAEKIGVGGNNAAITTIRGQSLDSDAIKAISEMLQTPDIIPQPGAERGTRFSMEGNYRRSAGEVEARNASRRAALSPEERAATPPWETEDVPQDRQMVRFSVAKTRAGKTFALLDRPVDIDWNSRDAVHDYLVEQVGKGAVSLADGKRIRIGADLPKEYTRSNYAQQAFRTKRLRKVRGKAAKHLDDIMVASDAPEMETSIHRSDRTYYRRPVGFGVAGHEKSRGYSADMVTYEQGGEEYLYDIVRIREDRSLSSALDAGRHGGYEILSTHSGERSTRGIIAEPAADRNGVRYSRRGGGIDGALEDAESALRALDAGEVRTEDRLEEHLRDMSKAAWLHRVGATDVPDRGASDYGGNTPLKAQKTGAVRVAGYGSGC